MISANMARMQYQLRKYHDAVILQVGNQNEMLT